MVLGVNITPVMYIDPSGENFIAVALIVGGSILGLYFLTTLVVGDYLGIMDSAKELLDSVGTSIANSVDNLKEKINKANKVITVSIAITLMSIKDKSNNGTYAIQFSDGSYYIGKGGLLRMYASAFREGLLHDSFPTSFRFEWATSDREAYKKEYTWMVDYGYYSKTDKMYNRIWSPGRGYYYADYGVLYSDDYFGR